MKRFTLTITTTAVLISTCAAISAASHAQDRFIDVVPAGSSQGASSDQTTSLEEAFAEAARFLNLGGKRKVTVRIRSGSFGDPARAAPLALPAIDNPEGSLMIKGGFDEQFDRRAPFDRPTFIEPAYEGDIPAIEVAAGTRLKSLAFDGLTFDLAPRAPQPGATPGWGDWHVNGSWAIQFRYPVLDRLEIRRCAFFNSRGRVTELLAKAASDDAEFIIEECLFFNCRTPLKLDAAFHTHRPARVAAIGCTFVLNWPHALSEWTGLPAALDVGPWRAAGEYVVRGNTFHGNAGAAIMIGWTDPEWIEISGNTFSGNGFIFGSSSGGGARALIVQTSLEKKVYDAAQISSAEGVSLAEGNRIADLRLPALGDASLSDTSAQSASRFRSCWIVPRDQSLRPYFPEEPR